MAVVVGSRRTRKLEAALVYLALAALTAAFLFPLLWVLGLSLKTRPQIFADPPLYLWWPTLEHYLDVLSRADFLKAFLNTLIVSAAARSRAVVFSPYLIAAVSKKNGISVA